MANTIDEFLAWRAFHFMYRQLQGISQGLGYNTDPLVTIDYAEYKAAVKQYAVFFECSGHDAGDHGVGAGGGALGGPRVNMEVQFLILGNVRYKTNVPRKEAFALEQDIRTAIHKSIQTIKTTTGTQFSLRWGTCPHDAGAIAADKEAGFRLAFSLGYPQGQTW